MMFGRILDEARLAQGFKSQAQLDAFYRMMDHKDGCSECGKPAPGMWIDDGYQPAAAECPEGRRLSVESMTTV